MKKSIHLLKVIFISFIYQFSAYSAEINLPASDYNGVYEGVIQTRRGSGLYGFGGKKSLIRLHIFVYNYVNTKYRDMYDRSAKKMVRPRTVMGLLEVFDNKKGKGTPKRSYFTAKSYASSKELNIDYIVKYAAEQNGEIKLNSGKVSKFVIPNSNAAEVEIKPSYYYQGKYRKVKSYMQLPAVFNPYLQAVLNETGRRSRGKISIGSTGSKSEYNLWAKSPRPNQKVLDVNLDYGNSSSGSAQNLSMRWINNLEYGLERCLRNKSFGASENLTFLPNTDELAVYINSSPYSGDKRIHFFNVKIGRKDGPLDFVISRTSDAKGYEEKAKISDNKKREEAERKRKALEAKEARLREKERQIQQAEQKAISQNSKNTGSLKKLSINTLGLKYPSIVQNIFNGEFDKLDFTRDESAFGAVFSGYMRAVSKNCKSSLPADKIELTRSECKREQVTTNGYGIEVSRICVEYVDIPTGIFVSPKVYEAYQTLSGAQGITSIANYFSMLGNPERLSNITKEAKKNNVIGQDMATFIKTNGCKGEAIQRLEYNLIAYINNEPPKTSNQNNPALLSTGGVDYSSQINYTKLLDDIFYADSKSWMFPYIPGIVSIKSIQKVPGRNVPSRIEAVYLYEVSSKRRRDTAVLTFKKGVPDCITYPSFFTPCKAVSRQVIAKLRQGYYNKKKEANK